MKIVIPDPIRSIPEKYIKSIRELGADLYDDLPSSQEEIVKRIKDAEIITANYININPELIDAAPNLKYVITPSVGFEWLDVSYAAQKGVAIINCPTFVPLSVAEHAMALIFALAKRLPEASSGLRKGVWDPINNTGVELSGKTLGLVGYGNIGKHLERIAQGVGLRVNYVNSSSSMDEVDELLRGSDFICLCLPLNDKTRHLIDDRRLRLLKKNAYLVNIARGAIIDQKALIENLKQGNFAGAGLDVYEGEPANAEGRPSDEILELVNMPNVIGTPHSAFNTPETLDRLGQEILANIQACLDGKPINIVNKVKS